ncbi:M13 family metallopeptidase [Fluviicola taffensis]|uniref:Endothelin-converting enzyme 1 n=1 Tax=Fluviicola taffensis (strain DSM 16823 / NCIMB 13979 / RW262) TaxID=755732 RepID=F2ICE6_FLUTR|nr:M13 family metallopeptidase [Fluviicola taffensis]AEA45416.1 Endothelin-converting enzyme 1 [Fluviicola taffensis DSM 16823]
MVNKILPLAVVALSITACQPKTVVEAPSKTASSTPEVALKPMTIDISYMDLSVKPQDDFFQFANGTWCKNNPVPNSESRWGSFNELDKRNKETLKQILETSANSKSKTAGNQEQLLGDYYTSYTNMPVRNAAGVKPLTDRLNKISEIKSKDEIVDAVAKQHQLYIGSLFGIYVGQDLKNVDANKIYMSQSGIGLPNRDYYFQENKQAIRDGYILHIQKSFQLLGESEASAKTKASDIFNFEKELASAMMTPSESRLPEKTYNMMSLDQVVKLMPKFDFESYLSKIGSESFDSLIVEQPEFIKKVNTMMEKVSLQSWTNYLSWCTINTYAGTLNETWVKHNFDFYGGVLSGTTVMKPIDDRCIEELTGNALSELLGKAFVEKNFSESAKKRVNTMVDNLLISFRSRIQGLDWMSDDTKKEALTKLNAIGRKLGFPDEWKSYNGLVISPSDYVTNVENCRTFSYKENLAKLHKPVNRKEWEMPAHLVNAYYHPLLNEIAFPAGIMQPPFFDENAEDAVNYGRIGMVIGHEFTHGFDDNGSKFAADGSYNDWWKDADKEKFVSRTEILGKTFGSFCPITDNCVNPELTMGENIADLGGLTMAYYAYTMTDDFKKNVIIDGYTPAQRFFISYAQLWKINYTEAELKKRIATDSHSPGMYRVNGPLMNCPEFFAAFNVKPGDKMRNPDEKVAKIW